MHKLIIILFSLIISYKLIYAQNEVISNDRELFPILQLKISSSLLLGEIPLIIEYRPYRNIGNEFTSSYVYLYPIIASEKLSCTGYKFTYGLKIYVHKNFKKSREFYLNLQIFYKEIWASDRYYSEDGPIIYGGGECYDRYWYNLHKRVYGFKFFTGWAIKRTHLIFELRFGPGLRYIKTWRTNVRWWTVNCYRFSHDYDYNYNNLPKEMVLEAIAPTIHFELGFNFNIIQKPYK
ncbi:MAG: hypothetical protein HY738_12865 [Bacteroidia bacterium]|nr:hypothetical protein [Bacteroidia bacterium]